MEETIKIKLKTIIEGLDSLKTLRKEILSLTDAQAKTNNNKLEFGASKAEAGTLASAINDLAKAVRELPAALARASEGGHKLMRAFADIVGVAANIGVIVQTTIQTLKFFGVSADTVKAVIGKAFSAISGVFSSLKHNVGGALSAIKSGIASFASEAGAAVSGGVAGLRGALSGLISSMGKAVPALAGGGGAIVAIGGAAVIATAAIAALVGAVLAAVAAIGAVVAVGTLGTAAILGLAKSGFEYNSALEQIKLGTGALIAQLSELRRNGIELKGIDAVNAGIHLADEQLRKLKIDAIQTTATFEELATAFQAAVGSGLSAGLSLDQIRQVTVGIAQAGAALGVPYNQLNQEIRSILEGTIDMNSRIAKNLGITNEEVKLWRQKGTLADELNKRLVMFGVAGVKAAQTLSGLKSNLQEALNVFTGEATTRAFETLKDRLSKILSKIFDFKAAGLDAAFKPIADLIDKYLVSGINRFADWLETAIDYAKRVGKFLGDNADIIGGILNLIDEITRDVVSIIGDIVGASSKTDVWRSILVGVRIVLTSIAGLVKIFRVMVAETANQFWVMANFITNYVIPAIERLLSTIPGLGQLVALLRLAGESGGKQAGAQENGGLGAKGGDITATGRTGSGKRGGGKGGGRGRDIRDAADDLERTRIENAFNEFKAKLKEEETALEASYRARTVSTERYFAEKLRIATKEIDAEIIRERYLLQLAEAKRARAKDGSERLQAQGEVERIESRINVLRTERGVKESEINREAAQAIEALNKEYQELAATLQEIQGYEFDAAVVRINEKYADILARATADGRKDIVDLINRIKEHERTLAKLAEQEKRYGALIANRDDELARIEEAVRRGEITEERAANLRIAKEKEYQAVLLDTLKAQLLLAEKANDTAKAAGLRTIIREIEASGQLFNPERLGFEQANFERIRARLAVEQRKIDELVRRGDITPESGDDRRIENERAFRGELELSIARMRELAAATASLDDDIAVENLAQDIESLGEKANTLKIGVVDALRSGLGGFLRDLATGASNVKESFGNMISSILSQMAQLAGNELLRWLFSSLSGGASGGGGFFASLFGNLKFAQGGYVSGQGTGTSDSIPAMLSNGEFVLRASAVRGIGLSFLNMLNRGGGLSRFNAGGIAGADSSNGVSATDSRGLRIINVIDPDLVRDYMATSAGEQAVINVLRKNSGLIKQYIT